VADAELGELRLEASRGEGGAVVASEGGTADLTAKDRQLVAEYENLEFLRSILPAEQHDQLQQAADDDVQG
jgi:molybdenum-dependent DNA-binding transcriptional regulator ModE